MPDIGAFNREQFDAAASVQRYEQLHGLTACEAALFEAWVPRGARIVDLGVGAGRTTPWLVERGTSYLGIDIAPAMVEAARRLHPGVDLRVGDAADLSELPDASADVVVFSFNGIDYLADPLRIAALTEVRRVLVPGGVFVFSTHNPRCVLAEIPRTGGRLPRRFAVACAMSAGRIRKLVLTAPFRRGEGWVLDPFQGGLQTHMAIPTKVEAELRGQGFEVVERANGDLPARPSSLRTPWWYYACRAQ